MTGSCVNSREEKISLFKFVYKRLGTPSKVVSPTGQLSKQPYSELTNSAPAVWSQPMDGKGASVTAGKNGKDAGMLPVVTVTEPGSPSGGSGGASPTGKDTKQPAAADAVAQPAASYFKLYR